MKCSNIHQGNKLASLDSHLDWFWISPLCFLSSGFFPCFDGFSEGFLNIGYTLSDQLRPSSFFVEISRNHCAEGDCTFILLRFPMLLSGFGKRTQMPSGVIKTCRLLEVDLTWCDIKTSILLNWSGHFEMHGKTHQLFVSSASLDFRIK